MEVPKGNSLCSYVKQPKISFFLLLTQKSENRRAEQVLPGGRVGTSGRGEEVEKW
jgi:hypothetical protein